MFFGDTIQDTRTLFFTCWEKYQQKNTLSPLEHEIIEVLLAHPEYHKIMEQREQFIEKQYAPELGETNPFLHLGLHLAIRDQIKINRPFGINTLFKNLLQKHQDPLIVEHLMMECFIECLWLAQRNHCPPDEQHYLTLLQQTLR